MTEQAGSLIKTPKQLITVVVLAFVIPIAVIILLVNYVAGGRHESAGAASMAPEAIAERLRPVGRVVLAEGGPASTGLRSGEAVYTLACGACHEAGLAGAPKTGDAAAWKPRIAQGFDTLVKHAVEGFKGMPAKGGNASLDPVEVARAVAYLGNHAGASFSEPGGGAAAGPAAPAAAAADTTAAGEKLYDGACAACHGTGIAGAPKTGDRAAWAPRLAQGVDGLTQSVLKGKGAMPPKGGAMAATEAEIHAAVAFLVGKAQ